MIIFFIFRKAARYDGQEEVVSTILLKFENITLMNIAFLFRGDFMKNVFWKKLFRWGEGAFLVESAANEQNSFPFNL